MIPVQHAAAARHAARVKLARAHLIDWVRLMSRAPGGYQAGWVHHRIARALEGFSAAVAAKRRPRLILTTQPRLGKSEIVSRTWPVWHMAKNPAHDFVCSTYGQDLASDMSRDARETARSPEAAQVFPSLVAAKRPSSKAVYQRNDIDRVDQWRVGNGATYRAVGVGGPLTGRGAHVLAVDDPIKDASEADSQLIRDRLWKWYTSTATTRLAPGAGVIVMATRWHDDDLIGRLLSRQHDGGDVWHVIDLPALAEADEPVAPEDRDLADMLEVGELWRRVGEALHPDRYDREALLQIKEVVGERVWSALYMCRPVPAGGGRIKREWFYERYAARPEDIARQADDVWISSDAAKKGDADSDHHVIQVWARKDGRRYLLDRVAARVEYPAYERLMDGMINKWAVHVRIRGGGALIEDTANGTTYMQIKGSWVKDVALIAFDPQRDTPGRDKSKGARAVYLERAAEAGSIILPDANVCPWVEDVLTWWCAFPRGAHDDDVDAASQLMMRWTLGDGEAPSLSADEWARALGAG